ncbi:MAG: hypothetical protein ACYC2O_11725 [Microthrixaceae bacterium]
MATSTEPPSPAPWEEDGADTERRPRRIAFYLTLAAVLVLVVSWVYVLFFYHPHVEDQLEDRTFPTQAEAVCAEAVAQLGNLELAQLATTAEDRATTVEQSNVILRQMVQELRPLVPTSPENVTDGVNEWLDDWDTYIGNREQYAAGLREDPETRFLETTKGTSTKGITRAINGFTEANDMESCSTPSDLS